MNRSDHSRSNRFHADFADRLAGAPEAAGAAARIRCGQPGRRRARTASGSGISVRIAEDLANFVDDGATRRVLPVIGKGSLQNITDLKLLRGIDAAIVQADVSIMRNNKIIFPALNSVRPISPSFTTRNFTCYARNQDIKSVADLADKKVNVDLRGAGTGVTAARIFDLLKIAIIPTNDAARSGSGQVRRATLPRSPSSPASRRRSSAT